MSEDVLITFTRGNNALPVAANIVVQIDKMSSQEAVTHQGGDPHFTYKAYTSLLPSNNPLFLLFRDHMIDQNYIDPITKTNRKFLIINDPEWHPLNYHWQWVCTRMRGT